KEVFMWRVFAELSFKQIGQIFGKSENWACVTYHRARNKIKERLEVDYHEE
ncbi:MAG: sigma-70 family RNA polymerase sigma factor, partial [Peptococcaceae bacterium]|nr:sigma-70 family RNA polymerase sigma factor [Peptococcaceae bacterium]